MKQLEGNVAVPPFQAPWIRRFHLREILFGLLLAAFFGIVFMAGEPGLWSFFGLRASIESYIYLGGVLVTLGCSVDIWHCFPYLGTYVLKRFQDNYVQ